MFRLDCFSFFSSVELLTRVSQNRAYWTRHFLFFVGRTTFFLLPMLAVMVRNET